MCCFFWMSGLLLVIEIIKMWIKMRKFLEKIDMFSDVIDFVWKGWIVFKNPNLSNENKKIEIVKFIQEYMLSNNNGENNSEKENKESEIILEENNH